MTISYSNPLRKKAKNAFINSIGIVLGADFIYKEDWAQLPGTVGVVAGTGVVTGTDTRFTELEPGDTIYIEDALITASPSELTVDVITDDTSMTIVETLDGNLTAPKDIYVKDEANAFIPLPLNFIGLNAIHTVTGITSAGHQLVYDPANNALRAFASGGAEISPLDPVPPGATDGDDLQNLTAIVAAIGR